MRRVLVEAVLWAALLTAVAGCGGGTAAPNKHHPPRPRLTDATISGPGSKCLSQVSPTSLLDTAPSAGDTFDLRRPGNGQSEGKVVGVPTKVWPLGTAGCAIVLNFKIPTNLGFYVVNDETAGVSWGPFDSHNLRREGWMLDLTWSG